MRDARVPTAPFAVLRDDADAAVCDLAFPLFVKPIAEGTGKGCERASRVGDHTELHSAAQGIRARFNQPAIAEPFLPGREFTVGITGTGDEASIVAVMEIVLRDAAAGSVYSFVDKELCETRVNYVLADDPEARLAGSTALAAYRALDCRDAGRVDLRSDAGGIPQFLEVNVLPGLHPTHGDLPILAGLAGVSYDALIGRIMDACLLRNGLQQPARRRA